MDKFKTFLFPVNLLCVSKLNKFVFNQYMMFRFINIWPKSSNVSLGEGINVQKKHAIENNK